MDVELASFLIKGAALTAVTVVTSEIIKHCLSKERPLKVVDKEELAGRFIQADDEGDFKTLDPDLYEGLQKECSKYGVDFNSLKFTAYYIDRDGDYTAYYNKKYPGNKKDQWAITYNRNGFRWVREFK